MNYVEIFDDVVSIMQKDSATCEDMGAGNYQAYKALIKNNMPEDRFSYIIKSIWPASLRRGISDLL